MRRNKTSTTPLFADQKTHPQWSREGRILPVFEPRKPLPLEAAAERDKQQ